MTDEQSAALVNAQAALLFAEISQLNAVNAYYTSRGEPPVRGESDYQGVIDKYSRFLRDDIVVNTFVNGEIPR